MTCVTLELKPQEKREIEYEQQKKSLMEDIHFNIIFKCIYLRANFTFPDPGVAVLPGSPDIHAVI